MNVDLVQVACSVTDHNVAVKGLQKSDFILREDAKPQEIKYLWQQAELPLSIGLIIDVSGSQSSLVHKHRHTVAQFLKQVLRPEDRAMIVSVGGQVWLNADLTNSIPDLETAIADVGSRHSQAPMLGDPCQAAGRKAHGRASRMRLRYPCGGTVLWNAVYYASKLKLRQVTSSQPGRKALLILSDGLDTGSDHHLNDAIEAAQSAGVPVYTIKYVDPLLLPFMAVAALKHDMQTLSRETGGVAFGVFHGNLDDVFRQIEEELRNQYVLAYTPSNRAQDGSYRKLEIEVDGRPMLQVRTRKGYRAATE
ncbi:MAG: VWA domain-containing protein [Acidobacteriota bacterium]|nr:VWA domain-containing protein [Acidobacteriota bacterium]